jgi:hypothetical protein
VVAVVAVLPLTDLGVEDLGVVDHSAIEKPVNSSMVA